MQREEFRHTMAGKRLWQETIGNEPKLNGITVTALQQPTNNKNGTIYRAAPILEESQSHGTVTRHRAVAISYAYL